MQDADFLGFYLVIAQAWCLGLKTQTSELLGGLRQFGFNRSIEP